MSRSPLWLVPLVLVSCINSRSLRIAQKDANGQTTYIEKPWKGCGKNAWDDRQDSCNEAFRLAGSDPAAALANLYEKNGLDNVATPLSEDVYYDIGILEEMLGHWPAALFAFKAARSDVSRFEDDRKEYALALRLVRNPTPDIKGRMVGDAVQKFTGHFPLVCTGPLTIEDVVIGPIDGPLVEASDGCALKIIRSEIKGRRWGMPGEALSTGDHVDDEIVRAKGNAAIEIVDSKLDAKSTEIFVTGSVAVHVTGGSVGRVIAEGTSVLHLENTVATRVFLRRGVTANLENVSSSELMVTCDRATLSITGMKAKRVDVSDCEAKVKDSTLAGVEVQAGALTVEGGTLGGTVFVAKKATLTNAGGAKLEGKLEPKDHGAVEGF